MKLMSAVATLTASLALVSALLGAAPFTPAIFLFIFYTPLAALSAALGYAPQAMVIVGATVAAWLLSPIRFESPFPTPILWLGGWIVGWAVVAAALCITGWRHALWAALGRSTGGA